MNKTKIKSKLLQKIERDEDLKRQKMELVNQYARYSEIPRFCRRKLNELEAQIETNSLKYNKILKNVY